MTQTISHALVLPDKDFMDWYRAAEPYTKAFERVAVVRSPAGNDLNRFRDVSAVQARGVWFNDDAVGHIRRAYPMVVRIDLIRANTPTELANVLNERVRLKDRFGEQMNNDRHIRDRFTLDWPTDSWVVRITRPFDQPLADGRRNEGIDIHAPAGTTVRAAAPGTVTTIVRQPTALGYGEYIQIGTTFEGENYLVTYAHLRDIAVTMGQTVKRGDVLGKSSTDSIRLVVQMPGKGLKGYILPDVVDPTMLIYVEDLKLYTTASVLNIRKGQGTQFDKVGKFASSEHARSLEPHGRVLQKIGTDETANQWVYLETSGGVTGYAAAWFLTARTPRSTPAINIVGMNLDVHHPLGKPDPNRMKGINWVRIGYDVSMKRGSTDLDAAYRLYKPVIERYARAGHKVLLVLTHQTYGEGQGYNWMDMNTERWRDLTGKYVDFVRRIAQQYAGQNLVHAYQIWNEQDTPPELARAAVPIPAQDYAHLLTEAIRAIRSVDPRVKIITGGHVGGPVKGTAYARATLAAMPSSVRPDGVAFHPYGRGPAGSPYSIFGSIEEEVDRYSQVLPGAPVWITEWGVLDRQGIDPPGPVAEYAIGFLNILKNKYPDKIAAAMWFAWADSMDNGYGLVGQDDQPKQPLYDLFLQAGR